MATDTKDTKEVKQEDIKGLNLYQKLAEITGEIGAIAKGGTNKEQGYGYIEYAAVAGSLRSLFAKYHVVCIPNMGDRTDTEVKSGSGKVGYHTLIKFKFTFINSDNPTEREVIDWDGEATDFGDKVTNKAATGALKYCLMRTFNVSEKGDEDPDKHTPEVAEFGNTRTYSEEPATIKQKALIARKLEEKGVVKEDMQGYLIEQYGVGDPEHMSKRDASAVLDSLVGAQQ